MVAEHFFWITSRAAGIAALLAATAAVAVGLLMGGRMRKGPELRTTHEALSLATLTALAVHALSLLGDGYLKPSLADVTVPFAWSYQTLWAAVGIVAGWAFVILGLSYYLRGRIGPQRWRRLHRFTALAWLLGVLHAVMMGTDAGTAWFLLPLVMTVAPTLALLARRMRPTTPKAVTA
jgi:methionine sulfoxide reductase heme-binding subunit